MWEVRDLGLVPYREALAVQLTCAREVAEGHPGYWLLLRHPPVVTAGRRQDVLKDLLVGEEDLRKLGIDLIRTSRGGRLTYHHPGQIIGYPILQLRRERLGVRRYVGLISDLLEEFLAALGIPATRVENHPGVWVVHEGMEKKVVSIGVHVRHGVTMHGFALNVFQDRRPFSFMRWCGMGAENITSLEELKRVNWDLNELSAHLSARVKDKARALHG